MTPMIRATHYKAGDVVEIDAHLQSKNQKPWDTFLRETLNQEQADLLNSGELTLDVRYADNRPAKGYGG